MIGPHLKIFVGIVFVALGLGYIYRPDIIERINRVLRETLLNDSFVALYRRNFGFLLILLGVAAICMGAGRFLFR